MMDIPAADPAPLAYFDPGNGRKIAYRFRARSPELDAPTMMFLPGYASDMDGTKALELDRFAAAVGLGFLRFDYSGTGSSGGDFADGTLTRWLDEAVALIDLLLDGPVLLVGSSMGGWLALQMALKRPDRIAAIVGIAAAPDFTDWGFTPEQRQSLLTTSRFEKLGVDGAPPQVTHARFVESGAALRMLHSPIAIGCPVRLIHGDKDTDVPVGVAFKLLESLHSGDVQLTVIKYGDHRLSRPHELEVLLRVIAVLAERLCE